MKRAIKRLITRFEVAYLRMLANEAEKDACVIQAESLTAPSRLISVRSYITDLRNRIAQLEAAQ